VLSSCHLRRDGFLCTQNEGLDLYEKRIAPILEDDRPKSCNQCHLSGVDLTNFVQDTPCQTMACLEDKGLVDLDDPDDSVILTWIERASPDSNLITEEVIQQEYDGFLEWIEFNAACGSETCESYDDPCGDGPLDTDCEYVPGQTEQQEFDDPGDCSDLTIELAFREKVYAWRGRCQPCHYSNHTAEPKDAPRWIQVGECDEGSLATMRNVEHGGLINVEDPKQSLLLLKPLPESYGGVEHGGHDKFHDETDPAYLDFLYWLERYAQCNG
jgi:hypothetical protein